MHTLIEDQTAELGNLQLAQRIDECIAIWNQVTFIHKHILRALYMYTYIHTYTDQGSRGGAWQPPGGAAHR